MKHFVVLSQLIVALSLSLGLAGCADEVNTNKSSLKRAWADRDNPFKMEQSESFVRDYRELPTQGRAIKTPWSASYWPNRLRGIARRYQRPKVSKDLDRNDILRMSAEKVAMLSPAEKLDIYLGRYHFPLTEKERKKKGFFTPGWYGMCHGWTPAAIREPVPGEEVTLRNSDGVSIKFYQDDIKALLIRAYAGQKGDLIYLGSRTSEKDTNAGTLHLLITNMLGLRGESFGIDKDFGKEVWNQPLESYTLSYGELTRLNSNSFRASKRAAGTVYLIDVETELTYVDEHLGGKTFPRPNQFRHMYMHYSLELDANYQIIGGEYYPKYWKEIKTRNGQLKKIWTDQIWPDYTFLVTAAPKDERLAPYSVIKKILNRSLGY